MKIRVTSKDAGAPMKPGMAIKGHIYIGNSYFQQREGEDAVYTPLFDEHYKPEVRCENSYPGHFYPFLRIHPTEGLTLVWLDQIEMYEVKQPTAVDLRFNWSDTWYL